MIRAATISFLVLLTAISFSDVAANPVGDERNELGLFLGYTDADSDNGLSVGIDYAHNLGPRFGIGGVIEYTSADIRDGIIAMTLTWHTWRELMLLVAPGVEVDTVGGSDEFLVRLGVEYGFDIGEGYALVPALYFDVTSDEDAVVFGFSIARGF